MIITIIVLLILAGVSISMVVGDNGVLTQAQKASVKSNQASAQEAIDTAMVSIKSSFMGDVWTNNVNAKMNEYATYGELSKQIKNNGYEVKINGASVNDDNNDTKLVGGELVSLNKAGSENKYVYTVAVTDDSISAVSWTIVTDDGNNGLSFGDELENSKGERFYVIPTKADIDASRTAPTGDTIQIIAKYSLNKAGTTQINAVYGDTACAFSSTNYWAANMDLNEYTTPEVASSNSQTKENNAILKARNYGAANGGIGKLLIYDDANAIETSGTERLKYILWGKDNEQTNNKTYLYYWLGSAFDDDGRDVWYVVGELERLNRGSFGIDYGYGVRPVITISKSAVQ